MKILLDKIYFLLQKNILIFKLAVWKSYEEII